MELGEEIWELICKSIDEDDYQFLESISLVSTTLLAITNRVRSTFVITDRTLPFLHRHLLRFRNLKRIKFFDFTTNSDPTLQQISLSGLTNLEMIDISNMSHFPDFKKLGVKMLSGVKELNCSRVVGLGEYELVSIGVCFPFLQCLDISYCPSHVFDSWVISLSFKLKRLLQINISGNLWITYKSLVSQSENCLLLTEIKFNDCDSISSDGAEFVLWSSLNLECLEIKRNGWEPSPSFPNNVRCLSQLYLSGVFLSDESICLIGDAKLPLKKLALAHCGGGGFHFDGILYLLNKYQTLVHLDLQGSSFRDDDMVKELEMFLRCLTFLDLSFCSKLTGLAFFSIVEKCVSLKRFRMVNTNFGVEKYSKELNIKSGIKSLYISGNYNLRDEYLEKLSRHCPFLETLEVGGCRLITSYGILEVLRNCGELRSLDIRKCTGIKNLRALVFELPKLISLRACETGIDDEDLDMISKRCQRLLHLDLEVCLNVAERGGEECCRELHSFKRDKP